ncbi:MAG: DNA translocase FtsK [Candidatus Omnitrophica bacterium]|nr:DNA translocase FtsK [Candidatus Omnitrophota bacterium]
MDTKRWNEIQAIVLFAVAVFILLSLASFSFSDIPNFSSKPNMPVRNFAGVFGAYVGLALFFVMGYSSYVMPVLVLSWAMARLFGVTPQKIYFKICGTFFLILASSSIFSIIGNGDNSSRFGLGGVVGLVFSDFLVTYLGRGGALIVIFVLFLLSVLLATEFLLLPFLAGIYKRFTGRTIDFGADEDQKKAPRVQKKATIKLPPEESEQLAKKAKDGVISRSKEAIENLKATITPRVIKDHTIKPPTPSALPKKDTSVVKKQDLPAAPAAKQPSQAPAKPIPQPNQGVYKLPGADLLDTPPPPESRKMQEDLEGAANILEETLRDFDIEGKVVEINKGPVITRYELEPAPGVKVNRITSLSDNIALAMKAQSIRIVAPIPGKGTIGFEVPNSSSALVYFRDVLDSKEFRESKSPLKLGLGKDIAGIPVIVDLAKMPHLLIAGATGSGKTVCVNTIIASLLYTCSPDELKLLMIDPKRVELAVFNDLPHLLSPVVTDVKKVASTLDWIVNEMDARYETLAKAGVRNIDAYNERFGKSPEEKMPYIVILIDELADLMMVAQADVEGAITRLAQLSRAVGIHIVIATQRPSVDVITGVIKANLPARISFKVASKVDSRTVLDMNGADKLLGRGDMLIIEPGIPKPVRAQCSLILDKEIERITGFIKSQRGPQYVDGILEVQKKTGFKKFDKDEVYEEAVKLILETRQASVSVLQRRLGVGYTRAARLIDMMEDEGIVGPYQGSKPRDLLISLEEYQARTAPVSEGDKSE